jgi:PKD repeat protein
MRRLAFVPLLAALLAPAAPARAEDPGRWVQTNRATVPLEYYQGVTVDPRRNLYFDGIHVGLYRTDPALRETARNDDVIPPEVTALEGYNHIGDITWDAREGGRILLPLECYYPPGQSATFGGNTCPAGNLRAGGVVLGTGAIGVAQPVETPAGRGTFAWRYYVKLDETTPIRKAMWAEVAPDGELFWTQGGAGTETGGGGRDLLAFRTADVKPENAEDPKAPTGKRIQAVRRLRGAVPCSGITGATFYDGRLFVAGQNACDGESDPPFRVWSIDLATGEKRLEIERPITGESEGLVTVRTLGGILHWLIQPYNTEGPPTYGVSNGTLLSFAPKAETVFDGETTEGGGIGCRDEQGVRFCEGSVGNRVKSWDADGDGGEEGVPLDVNVTLPASGEGPFPLIVQLHGWGGAKSDVRASRAWAQRGYAVLNYTARGFGHSCGSRDSRAATPEACAKGWIRLADSRYEVRDTQHLAGLLADEGIADPRRIGVMGGSYGGGQSTMLAVLRDRVRLPDGSYAPWRSPRRGLDMRIAAAVPTIPWTDLTYSLLPNGRTLDHVLTDEDDDLDPIGVMKATFVTGLYAAGAASGHYAPPRVDPDADLQTWYARIAAGDPYDPDPIVREAARIIAQMKSPYYLEMDREPAPTLISNGFTDDLFPVDEAVRWVNEVRARQPGATVAQLHFDYGHARGQREPPELPLLQAETFDWMDRYVKGDAQATALTGATVGPQSCGTPSRGTFHAPSWHELHPGEVRFAASPEAKTILPAGGSPEAARAFDPIAGGGGCATAPADDAAGTATYRLPVARGDGYTLVGAPVVVADLAVRGTPNAAIAARLLDVDPATGRQTLVARGLYRPDASGRQVFQLHPNAWRFAPGHVAKLELLGHDAPYGRPANAAFAVEVSKLELRLPVRERPDCDQVLSPAPPVVPEGATLAPGVDARPDDACDLPPEASFAWEPESPLSGEQVRFVATVTDDDGPGGVSLRWDLDGDGELDDGTGPEVAHAYARPGTYAVRLRASDAEGESAEVTRSVVVRNRPPEASFAVSSERVRAGDDVTFSSTSIDPDGEIVRERWDLDGDGEHDDGEGPSAARRFGEPGTYVVRLESTDDAGAADVAEREIVVEPAAGGGGDGGSGGEGGDGGGPSGGGTGGDQGAGPSGGGAPSGGQPGGSAPETGAGAPAGGDGVASERADTRPARCLRPRLRVSSRGVDGLRVGLTRQQVVDHAGRPVEERGRVLRWCVRGGGTALAVLGRDGRVALVVSSARGHQGASGIGPRDALRSLRRAHPRSAPIARGVLVQRRGSRVLYGVRGRRVAWVGLASRRLVGRPAELRAHLRLARVR